jgi:hypothetical protein
MVEKIIIHNDETFGEEATVVEDSLFMLPLGLNQTYRDLLDIAKISTATNLLTVE